MTLLKARLIELDPSFTNPKDGGKNVPVQFNPETLKLTYANQLVEPKGGDQAAGTAGRQFVGAGTTKLALQLWFDVGAMEETTDPESTGEAGIVDDVRRLTQHVVFFMTPQPSDVDPAQLAPPGVRFEWGSFAFDGMVEGMEESIEFFSPQGKPLRASISLTLSAQKILPRDSSADTGPLAARVGHTPLKVAKAGDSLQGLAAAGGKGGDWQGIAAANGIEDPLRMAPGQFINLQAKVGASVGGGLGFGAGIGGGGAGGGLAVGAALAGAPGAPGAPGASGTSGTSGTLGLPTVGVNASLGGASASLSFG